MARPLMLLLKLKMAIYLLFPLSPCFRRTRRRQTLNYPITSYPFVFLTLLER